MRILIIQILLLFTFCAFGQKDSSYAMICYEFTPIWVDKLNDKIHSAQHLKTEIVILDSSAVIRQNELKDTLVLYAVEISYKKGDDWKLREFLRICWASNVSEFYEIELLDYNYDEYFIGTIEKDRVEVLRKKEHFIYLNKLITWKETLHEERL